ncbi:MAG: PstS family phosphate ABC transporter substrate-binding protein [Candidatus Bathyarchaeota archaeon]|nr:MAG: PstS family phosphate ABC transporter substrate-binding protein [Candidatus Bathyarchaeota archaeon]
MRKESVLVLFFAAIVVAAIGFFLMATTQPSTVQIQQKGSDTMLILAQNWAEAYMDRGGGVEVVVSGGGTGTGISALINRIIDLADASRPIKQEEREAAEARGVSPVEWRVTLDGISVIVNRANVVGELDYDQLRRIYNGSVTSWSQVGGADAPVVAYGRQSTSGTYVYFNEEVLEGDDFRPDKNQMAGNSDIVEAVINDPNGIGYVGVAYAEARREELRIISVRLDAASSAYQPTGKNIASGDYPISRFLLLYTDGIPTGAAADYLGFVLSPEGQEIVEALGYISLPQGLRVEQIDRLG